MARPTIGILAGMGPRSTGPFLDLVVTACQEMYGARHDIDFPKMLVCSQPAPFYEDRPIDHAALEAATLEGLQTLESAGVDFLAMACNTVHLYYDRLAAALAVPLIDIVQTTVQAIPASVRTVALVAARPTAESGLFQKALSASGRTVVDLGWQDHVDGMLSAVRDTTEDDAFRRLWQPVTGQAGAARVDAIVVACLDLSATVRHADRKGLVIDAAQCLARAVVARWLADRGRGQPAAAIA